MNAPPSAWQLALWLIPPVGVALWYLSPLVAGPRLPATAKKSPAARVWAVLLALFQLACLIALPVVTGFAWYWVPALVGGSVVMLVVPGLVFSKQDARYFQLRNALSGLAFALLLAAVGVLSGRAIWLLSGAVFLVVAAWNVYGECTVRPVVSEFYSDLNDSNLWTSFVLVEEAPLGLVPLVALLALPAMGTPLGVAELIALANRSLVVVGIFMALLVALAIGVGPLVKDEGKRIAVARLLAGAVAFAALFAAAALALRAQLFAGQTVNVAAMFDKAPGTVFAPTNVLACTAAAACAALVGVLACLISTLLVIYRRPEYDLFLSYCSADAKRAARICDELRGRGVRVFHAVSSIPEGDPFRERIQKAIRNSREMAVLCTSASLGSAWVRFECTCATVLGKRITPILDGVDPRRLPPELEGRQAIAADRVGELGARLRRDLSRFSPLSYTSSVLNDAASAHRSLRAVAVDDLVSPTDDFAAHKRRMARGLARRLLGHVEPELAREATKTILDSAFRTRSSETVDTVNTSEDTGLNALLPTGILLSLPSLFTGSEGPRPQRTTQRVRRVRRTELSLDVRQLMAAEDRIRRQSTSAFPAPWLFGFGAGVLALLFGQHRRAAKASVIEALLLWVSLKAQQAGRSLSLDQAMEEVVREYGIRG